MHVEKCASKRIIRSDALDVHPESAGLGLGAIRIDYSLPKVRYVRAQAKHYKHYTNQPTLPRGPLSPRVERLDAFLRSAFTSSILALFSTSLLLFYNSFTLALSFVFARATMCTSQIFFY